MKTKNLFLGMVAGLFMVACANENDPVVENNQTNAKEYAYIKVNINDGGVFSRTEDGFDEGSDNERKVTDATFFFFDENGNVFNVSGTNNYVVKTVSEMGDHSSVTGNVSDFYSPILVIDKSTGKIPNRILAVINAPADLKTSMSLSTLKGKIADYRMNGTTFIMSNSVYADGGAQVDATFIPPTSIATSAEEAADKAIDIYVERVAAKITLDAGNNLFEVGGEENIYAKVIGWEVYNGTGTSKLIKSINPNWESNLLSIDWNDADNFRSYWAESTNEEFNGGTYSWNTISNSVGGSAYYNEYTASSSNLIVKVEFTDANGEKLPAIAEWVGERYILADLKTSMANMVASEIFVGVEGESAVSISAENIELVQREASNPNGYANGEKNYDILPVLNEPAEGLQYFNKTKEVITAAEATAMMQGIVPTAAIWGEGGYYVIPINHFGKSGLVRNHSYVVTVDAIQGLGTPVYDPQDLIWDEDFESKDAYIAASINILSWKIVDNNVTLQ